MKPTEILVGMRNGWRGVGDGWWGGVGETEIGCFNLRNNFNEISDPTDLPVLIPQSNSI